ncbi:MAG: hypothetical protein U0W24_22860 [Bacteroidales bacterium]
MKTKLTLLFLILNFLCYSQYNSNGLDSQINHGQGDGIFLTFEDLKNNKIIPKASIVFDSPYIDSGSISELLLHQFRFKYIDQAGKQRKVKAKDVFCFLENDNLFIYHSEKIFQLTKDKRLVILNTSKISTFYHEYAVVASNQYQDISGPGPLDLLGQGYYEEKDKLRKAEFIDWKTGKILELTPKNLNSILIEDKDLFDSYNKMTAIGKASKTAEYVEKFNNRNTF